MKISASQIKNILAKKHSDDIFVEECKIGSATMQQNCQIFDGWVMNKSWANHCCTGYEIKVSRSDFLGDLKYRGYLPYCHKLYFVCPYKMIAPEEIDGDIGLIWVSKNGTRLFTKKKALFRDIIIPDTLYRYILMYRVKITNSTFGYRSRETKKEYWKQWLKTKEVDRKFGWNVGSQIRKVVKEKVEDVESQNRRLENQNKSLEEVKEFLNEIGVEVRQWNLKYAVDKKIKKLNNLFPDGFARTVDEIIKHLETMKKIDQSERG